MNHSMRQIKFRGKPLEGNGDSKWVYGNACLDYEEKIAYIESPEKGSIPVKWDSVGQFIGLKDTTTWETLTEKEREQWIREGNMPSQWSGKEIYEADLVEYEMEVNDVWVLYEACEIVYNEEEAMFNFKDDGENPLNIYRNLRVVRDVHEKQSKQGA